MSIPHVKYLLVGGGVASSSAAQAIRSLDPDGSCLLVGQEISRPYHRPPLSKNYLRRKMTRGELFTLPSDWFEKHHVALRTGCRASHLNTARMSVTLDNGQEISFDRLLLATGGTAVKLEIPGASLPNVYYLRSLEDVDRLHKAVDKAMQEGHPRSEGRGRVAVVGGGFLGVELACSLTQMGLSVDLLLEREQPWSRFAGPSTAALLTRNLEGRGVRVHRHSAARSFEGDGRAQRISTASGAAIETDFVVVAVGMAAQKDLLRNTPIAAEKAILTDEFGQTNVAGIYAAGDCAAIFDPLFGKHRLLDQWAFASVSGALAGRNMAGAVELYGGVNFFFSSVFDLRLSGWGEPRLVDRRLMRDCTRGDRIDLVEVGVASDGKIAQVLHLGTDSHDPMLPELVRRRIRLNGNEELVKDPHRPLSDLLG